MGQRVVGQRGEPLARAGRCRAFGLFDRFVQTAQTFLYQRQRGLPADPPGDVVAPQAHCRGRAGRADDQHRRARGFVLQHAGLRPGDAHRRDADPAGAHAGRDRRGRLRAGGQAGSQHAVRAHDRPGRPTAGARGLPAIPVGAARPDAAQRGRAGRADARLRDGAGLFHGGHDQPAGRCAVCAVVLRGDCADLGPAGADPAGIPGAVAGHRPVLPRPGRGARGPCHDREQPKDRAAGRDRRGRRDHQVWPGRLAHAVALDAQHRRCARDRPAQPQHQ